MIYRWCVFHTLVGEEEKKKVESIYADQDDETVNNMIVCRLLGGETKRGRLREKTEVDIKAISRM